MKEDNLVQRIEVLYSQLSSLGEMIKSSINHKDESDSSYPQAAKRYNVILKQLQELTKDIDYIRESISQFTEYEEKSFMRHGNYRYAINLLTDINMLVSSISKFKSSITLEAKKMQGGKPLIFISYDGDELALADFVKVIITRWAADKIETFIARRDIGSGDNPLKTMMELKLKNADAIITICSIKSKESGWVWWESAALWAKDRKIFPLCSNISPGSFGAPLNLVSQGKYFFDEAEFMETIQVVCSEFDIQTEIKEFSQEEKKEYEKLKSEYSIPKTTSKIDVVFETLEMTQNLHKYSLIFDIWNLGDKAFENVVAELWFPTKYLEKTEWNYPHLQAVESEEKWGYTCLTFDFSALPDIGKRQFGKDLLPKKRLRIFGKGGISILQYHMTHDLWWDVTKYEAVWKVYINGGAPHEGKISLQSLQQF